MLSAGGVAVIKVGTFTGVELKEIKHRIEDALQATRAVERALSQVAAFPSLAASSVLDWQI